MRALHRSPLEMDSLLVLSGTLVSWRDPRASSNLVLWLPRCGEDFERQHWNYLAHSTGPLPHHQSPPRRGPHSPPITTGGLFHHTPTALVVHHLLIPGCDFICYRCSIKKEKKKKKKKEKKKKKNMCCAPVICSRFDVQ